MRERRHLLLLISILVLFMLSPFVVTFRHGVLFLNVFGAAILVAGSYALSERKQLFRTAVVLSAISIVATCLRLAFPQHWAVLVSHSSIILLVAFFCVSILAYLSRGARCAVSRVAHRPYEQAADAGRQLSQFPQSSLAEGINHQRANARAGKSQLTSAENKEQAPPLRRNPSPFAGRRRVR